MNKKKRIYLDYSATTPMDPRVIDVMCDFMGKKFGNPSSLHSFGRDARREVEKARSKCIDFIGADNPSEIIFNSGGTESDNLVLEGIINGTKEKIPHIITTSIEHKAVLEKLKDLEGQGLVKATYLRVDKYGQISIDTLKKEIKENTVLVSIMYANNEIGTVQPIREVGKFLEKLNKKRKKEGMPRIYLHTDAVQAFAYLPCNVKYLHVDLMSISSHKIYGPKGVGFLYVKENTPLKHNIVGGAQEFKKRAGTENTTSIIGLSKAIELLEFEQKEDDKKIKNLRNKLIEGVAKIPNVYLTGHPKERLPNLASFIFQGIEGESILINLDLEGVAVSTGSACTSGTLAMSHVLSACEYNPQEAQGNIRFSLGRFTTEEEINRVLEVLPSIISKLRNISPISK